MAKYYDGLDSVTTALAQPTRRQILGRLGYGRATSSQLSEITGIGLATIAKHTAVLSQAGLITSEKSGRVVTHQIVPNGLDDFESWISTRKSFWNDQLNALENHVENP